jgi:hypothetical protein
MPDSYTAIAFVEGIVEVFTIFMGDERPVVHLFARRENETDPTAMAKNTVFATADGQRYKLIVEPGQWQVWAELGVVKSQPIAVSLQEGETQKVNFVYGKK